MPRFRYLPPDERAELRCKAAMDFLAVTQARLLKVFAYLFFFNFG